MNPDDDSFLSAYLDDELDPADRLAIEGSIELSPRLAERLRSITQARDALIGLERPALPVDLGPALMARIDSGRRRPGPLARPAARFAFALSAFSSVAASLIFAIILLNQSLHETSKRPEVAAIPLDPIPAPRHHPEPVDAPILVETASPPPPTVAMAGGSLSSNQAALKEFGLVPGDDDRRIVGAILGRSHVRGIVIETDVIDAADRVSELIRQDPRGMPEFGRISIRQEIILDPDHTGPAEVFAVPIDERGRRTFVERLRKSFPDLIEEGRSKPSLVASLGETERVAVFRGIQAAPLGEPPDHLAPFIANRDLDRPPLFLETDRWPARFPGPAGPGLLPAQPPVGLVNGTSNGPNVSGQGSEFVGPPDLMAMAPPRPGERVTLLVWVTRPTSSHRPVDPSPSDPSP